MRRAEACAQTSKTCTICQHEKPISEFTRVRREGTTYLQGRCRLCNADYCRNYAATHKEQMRESCRRYRLRVAFGLSLEDYSARLAAQKGVCAICGGACKTGNSLAVDHDHQTGRVRGLLCQSCNTTLGHVRERREILERMIVYLREHS